MNRRRAEEEAKASSPRAEGEGKKASQFARFSLVCESRDGRLCLFKDAEGHYTAVRAARLA